MSIGGKIRFLLLIFGACCILTALSLNHAMTRNNFLTHEANTLQKNLSAKERLVYSFLNKPEQVEAAKRFDNNGGEALKFIENYREQGINLLIFKDDALQFWSSTRILPNVRKIKEGASFYSSKNGYYELVKKTSGDYVFLFFIAVKTQYYIENQYLKNQIAPELFANRSLSLADFTDKETRNIFSLKNEYLFQVKLNDSYSGGLYKNTQLWLWITGLLAIFLFVNSCCVRLLHKGYVLGSVLVLGLFVLVMRLSDLNYLWLNHQFNLEIFNPSIYAQSDLLPSLGDFLLNMLALTWFCVFIYIYRFRIVLPQFLVNRRWKGIVFHVVALLCVTGIAFLMEDVFYGLIDNSKINFDITNIINLSFPSIVSILILCLVWFNLFLFINILITISKFFPTTNRERLWLFLGGLIILFIYKLTNNFSVYFLVYALFIYMLAWNAYMQQNKFSIGIYVLLFFCMAFLSALKYVRFIDIKERSMRISIARKLMQTEEPRVINSISGFENKVARDSLIIDYFKNPKNIEPFQVQNYVIKNYLDGFLSRYEYRISEYNNRDSLFKGESAIPLANYKSLVRLGAVKVQGSDYFYQVNDTFGFYKYFGIIPVFSGGNLLGSMVIELTSQPFDINNYFPELLIDGKLKSDEDYSTYSFAFYKDNKLFGQSGQYTYETITSRFIGVLDKIVFLDENNPNYNHAIYKPSASKVIVISKARMSYILRLATLSFFFLVFITFSAVVYAVLWLVNNLNSDQFSWVKLNRYLMINANKILYKTRIQVTIVLAVVSSLLIVGWITFYYIKNEYRARQEIEIRGKIRKVQLAYEKVIATEGLKNDEAAVYEFNRFADVNAAFLNLYDINGNIYLTSLPRMYEYGILGPKMPPKAYINVRTNRQSAFINPSEKIGSFIYAAGYAPIRNSRNQTIAYIGLPYYNNEADYQEKIGLFINTLINIYALVFVLIGVLAVFLANQITHPLTFIQESIRRTKLGQKHQPIIWNRQDEIGSLIKEYNKMLEALEKSVQMLARSERESAWRKMAKQVAHEIKNPLTPLKLGVQLLERSWKEGDPNFDRKFAGFSKSFIEQIDSLANIASEFSNFAKMPDTKLEELKLIPIIEQAMRVFNAMDHIEISIINETSEDIRISGDKDQLLRSFNNLFKNAAEALEGEENGLVKIRVAEWQQTAFVEVEDNGKGIDESLGEKIFEPNFTTKSSGTGLGLAFVKQAVENAGGSIYFESTPGEGTTFYLRFPMLTG